ncbi:MAG: hypothetical protein Tsb0020_47330 [Haliangiales bacterium]
MSHYPSDCHSRLFLLYALLGLWALSAASCDTEQTGVDAAPPVVSPAPAEVAAPEVDRASDAGAAIDAQVYEPDASPPPDAAPQPKGKLLGNFSFTYYWMAKESTSRRRRAHLYDSSCKSIAKVSRSFAARVALEGTGMLRDGRVVNVSGACDCKSSPCFFLPDAEHRFGVGVNERPLAPFRSVAVDSKLVSIGTKLYVPELDGLTMPGVPPWGGFVHNGCVVADDRGGGVSGKQIDFFMVQKGFFQAFQRRHRMTQVTVYRAGKRCDQPQGPATAVDRNSI